MTTTEILSELRSQYNCFDELEEPVYRALSEAIKAVSAQRTGKWMATEADEPCFYRCSECGRLIDERENFCPNCGAKME